MRAGFHRVLLLAMTSTTLVHQAAAFSSETTDSPVTGFTTDDTAVATDAPAITGDTTDAATAPPATDGDTGDACLDERAACTADATCINCFAAGSSSAAELECREINALITSEEDCAANLDTICCLDAASEFECLDNEAYVGLAMCDLEDYGCLVDEITCDGDESTTEFDGAVGHRGPASIAIAFSFTFMVLLSLLWV